VLHLEGHAGDTPYRQDIDFDVKDASFHPGITTLWARQAVATQLDLWRDAATDQEREEKKAAIVEQAIRYNLVTRFTSLVAVEEQPAGPPGERTALVPTELPEGWQPANVAGTQPATGTADAFLEALGLCLLALGFGVMLLPRLVWSR
jgi:hypothetical protein